MASSYLRKKRAADRKKKEDRKKKKLAKYVRKKAARALRAGKAYRPKGKNAEERAFMDAVVEEVKAKMADRKEKQNKLVKHARREAARAVKCGKAYPKRENAEERAMMAAEEDGRWKSQTRKMVVEDGRWKMVEFQRKMEVTDKVAEDAARLSKKAMACSSKAMAAVKEVAASQATTKTEVEKLRKRQEVLEGKQEAIEGMKEEWEKRWEQKVAKRLEKRWEHIGQQETIDRMNSCLDRMGSCLAQAMAAEAPTGGKAQAMTERVAAMGTGRGRNEA